MSQNGARKIFPRSVSRLSLRARQHNESLVMCSWILREEIDSLQIWSVFFRGGTTTTRRPNNRASIEYAPGPSRASAAEFKKREAKSRTSTWTLAPKRLTSAYTHATNERYGVSNPMARHKTITKAPTKRGWTEDISVRFATINTKVAATEIRSTNRPMPGPPGGNIENSRCTMLKVKTFVHAPYPN